METSDLDWAAGYFYVFGVGFQNWMPIVALIIVIFVIFTWWMDRRSHRE